MMVTGMGWEAGADGAQAIVKKAIRQSAIAAEHLLYRIINILCCFGLINPHFEKLLWPFTDVVQETWREVTGKMERNRASLWLRIDESQARRLRYFRFSAASISANDGAGQSRTVPSKPHVAMRFPLGENATPNVPPGASVNANC